MCSVEALMQLGWIISSFLSRDTMLRCTPLHFSSLICLTHTVNSGKAFSECNFSCILMMVRCVGKLIAVLTLWTLNISWFWSLCPSPFMTWLGQRCIQFQVTSYSRTYLRETKIPVNWEKWAKHCVFSVTTLIRRQHSLASRSLSNLCGDPLPVKLRGIMQYKVNASRPISTN